MTTEWWNFQNSHERFAESETRYNLALLERAMLQLIKETGHDDLAIPAGLPPRGKNRTIESLGFIPQQSTSANPISFTPRLVLAGPTSVAPESKQIPLPVLPLSSPPLDETINEPRLLITDKKGQRKHMGVQPFEQPKEPQSDPCLMSESSLLSPPLSPRMDKDDEPPLGSQCVVDVTDLLVPIAQPPVAAQSLLTKPRARPSVSTIHAPGAIAKQRKADYSLKRSTLPQIPRLNPHRECLSCHIKQTPCWRPSWDVNLGQLCNSCGLRYRKTKIRCASLNCANVPSKLDLAAIRARSISPNRLKCPNCSGNLVKD